MLINLAMQQLIAKKIRITESTTRDSTRCSAQAVLESDAILHVVVLTNVHRLFYCLAAR